MLVLQYMLRMPCEFAYQMIEVLLCHVLVVSDEFCLLSLREYMHVHGAMIVKERCYVTEGAQVLTRLPSA